MLDHISFAVAALPRSIAFYDAVLDTLGYVRVWTAENAAGYGVPGGEDRFALKTLSDEASRPGPGFHLAFTAPTHQAVEEFHSRAIELGGEDNGPPGPRPQYGPDYYAAFVIDPDGYRIEAVCHAAV